MVSEIADKKNYGFEKKFSMLSDEKAKEFEVWEVKDGTKLVYNCDSMELNNSRKIRRNMKKKITHLTNLIR